MSTKAPTPKRRQSPPPGRPSETTRLTHKPRSRRNTTLTALVYGVLFGFLYFAVERWRDGWTVKTVVDGEVKGHADFEDGRRTTAPSAFVRPRSDALFHTNVMLGNDG